MSEKFVNEGFKREKYGLNLKKNEEIDRRREGLAQKQGEKGKRASLESSVSREGGSVRWDADAKKETVLPYTKAEGEKLEALTNEVISKLEKLNTVQGHRDKNIEQLTGMGFWTIKEFFVGKANFEISYSADGTLKVERFKEKENTNKKVYSFLDAVRVLRNLERYANAIEKIKSFSGRHDKPEVKS